MRSVGLQFKGVRALDDVSLSVAEGSLTALIGPNGAGKSSVFNCIAGFYRPGSGSIKFQGQELIGLRPARIARLGIARMFQNIHLFDSLSVLDNLMLGRHTAMTYGTLRSMLPFGTANRQETENRQAVEKIIDFLGIEPHRRVPAGLLPYGVQKRVELGRALAAEPSLLLLDEPFAGMNTEETEIMARYILDVHEEMRTTIMLVDHDMSMVMDLADEVTVLNFGHLLVSGPPEQVQADPSVLEAYLGSSRGSSSPPAPVADAAVRGGPR